MTVSPLSRPELDAALNLLVRTGLCGLLPRPFELEAIKWAWKDIRPLLGRVDLNDYRPGPALSLSAPKQKYLIRTIHLLDPLDALLYTALVRRLASKIERKRQPLKKKRVFSFRFDGSHKSKFEFVLGWQDFEARLLELCAERPYVAVADISDFFANIYLHRLQGAVFDATGMGAEAQTLFNWLAGWAPGGVRSSQGVPVGLVASNVLAEAMLIEVDDFLVDRGYEYARFVDDFYIFTESESAASQALYGLAEQLAVEDRLELNAAKTRVRTSQSLRGYLLSPHVKLRRRQKRLRAEVRHQDRYAPVDLEKLTADSRDFVKEVQAQQMLGAALKAPIINLRQVTAALEVLGAVGDTEAVDAVVERLPVLASVAPDVARFLLAQDRLGKRHVRSLARKVTKFLKSRVFQTAFQRIWLLEPFVRSTHWSDDAGLVHVWERDTHELVRRHALLGLGMSTKRASRLLVKRGLADSSSWVRRAALFSLRALTPDERKHAYPTFRKKAWDVGSALERAVVGFSKSLAK